MDKQFILQSILTKLAFHGLTAKDLLEFEKAQQPEPEKKKSK
jgi:hypothetical protein